MPEDLAAVWNGFRDEFEVRTKRLADEVEASWGDVRALIETLRGAGEPGERPSLEELFDDHARRLLHEPFGACLRKWPLLRVISAVEAFDSGLEDLVRRLPPRVETPPGEFLRSVDPDAARGWRGRWLGWRKSPVAVPLRAIIQSESLCDTLRRAELDGSTQLLLAQACLLMLGPWQLTRRRELAALLDREPGRQEWETERQWWLREAERCEARGLDLVRSFREWAVEAPRKLARATGRRTSPIADSSRQGLVDRRHRYLAYWSRQQRAVAAVISLERQLAELGREAAGASASAIESLKNEHGELAEELDTVTGWLTAWQEGERDRLFPPPSAKLLSAEERARDWLRRIHRAADSLLPMAVEAVAPRLALPGWRSPFRRLEPEKALRTALESSGAPVVTEGLKEAEAAHRVVVREIERAREVVAFGLESGGNGAKQDGEFATEAVSNALNLLLYQKRAVADPMPSAVRGLTRGQAGTLLETHVALEESRLGALAYVARERGERRARQLAQMSLESLRTLSRKTTRLLGRASDWFLQRTGWVTPVARPPAPVSERAFLGQTLEVHFGARSLPMLYQRLFRLAPVEDARFLIGRDAEMEGIQNAVGRWRDGHYTAVVVLGARGSGKTSLLKCAASSVLAGLPVISSQFCGRISRAAPLEEFLRGLFRVPEGTDLQAALSEGRRVVILEELERTFLRAIGGFEALRAFLRVVESTSKSTLWILSVNEMSFRYLDAAVSLGGAFSHRINAMSVRPEYISSAILQRHNLSGLRLEFAPLAEGDPRISRVRKFVGLEQDAQQLFFESLYAQSEGIFRSAFELWQDSIERVESGVIHMRQPLAPNYRPLLRELRLEDHFTLQAILQHGGLTEAEMALVTGWAGAECRQRVERLWALELLEPEPECPGFRVRPQAGRLVREALHRQNLW